MLNKCIELSLQLMTQQARDGLKVMYMKIETILTCCLKLTFEALSVILLSLQNKNQNFIESYGYRLDLFSAFQFHAFLFFQYFIYYPHIVLKTGL